MKRSLNEDELCQSKLCLHRRVYDLGLFLKYRPSGSGQVVPQMKTELKDLPSLSVPEVLTILDGWLAYFSKSKPETCMSQMEHLVGIFYMLAHSRTRYCDGQIARRARLLVIYWASQQDCLDLDFPGLLKDARADLRAQTPESFVGILRFLEFTSAYVAYAGSLKTDGALMTFLTQVVEAQLEKHPNVKGPLVTSALDVATQLILRNTKAQHAQFVGPLTLLLDACKVVLHENAYVGCHSAFAQLIEALVAVDAGFLVDYGLPDVFRELVKSVEDFLFPQLSLVKKESLRSRELVSCLRSTFGIMRVLYEKYQNFFIYPVPTDTNEIVLPEVKPEGVQATYPGGRPSSMMVNTWRPTLVDLMDTPWYLYKLRNSRPWGSVLDEDLAHDILRLGDVVFANDPSRLYHIIGALVDHRPYPCVS